MQKPRRTFNHRPDRLGTYSSEGCFSFRNSESHNHFSVPLSNQRQARPDRGGKYASQMFLAVDGKTITCSVRRREEDVNVAFLLSTRETGFLHPRAHLGASRVQIVDLHSPLALFMSVRTKNTSMGKGEETWQDVNIPQ